jgi:hypothetical protein
MGRSSPVTRSAREALASMAEGLSGRQIAPVDPRTAAVGRPTPNTEVDPTPTTGGYSADIPR